MATEPIGVSMYNVGFGDCFLLRFPTPDRERRVLIDCGSIKRGVPAGTDAIVERLIEDVTDDGVARIDVVVATHRHKDHVSGFDNEAWRDVVVDEVWLPWIENPSDARAQQILHEMASFALSLQAEAASLRGLSEAERQLVDHVIENTMSLNDGQRLDLSNDAAMATLHRGFSGGAGGAERRFLSRSPDPLDSKALPGVIVHRLGPSRDEAVIRDMNPPSDESFLRAAPGGGTDPGALLPFPSTMGPPSGLPSGLIGRLERMSMESTVLGAVALEKAVNNTSLMLAFEVGEAVLFFPGDAQWGAWAVNLEDERTRQLLKRTTFYKVGHHGSHNATPRTFVDEVLNESHPASIVAAASVTTHGRFTEIPKAELLRELEHKIGQHRVIRSDDPPAVGSEGVSVMSGADRVPLRIDFEVPVR